MTLTSSKGFSLIELVIVISIIGILSSIAIPNFNNFADKARYARAKSEMAGMATAVEGERVTDDKTFYQMIVDASGGNTCIACTEGRVVGADGIVATNLSDAQVLAAWNFMGYGKVPMDPWGRPYFLDQNEGEFGPTDCRHDMIYSAGSNHIVESDAVGDDVGGDDVAYKIPFFTQGCVSTPGNNPGFFGF